MTKLCVDCKWYEEGAMYHWCRREVRLDLVTGTRESGVKDCEDERTFKSKPSVSRPGTELVYGKPTYCGPDGFYWEPREKVLPRGEDLVEVFKPIKKARTRRAKPRGTKVNL